MVASRFGIVWIVGFLCVTSVNHLALAQVTFGKLVGTVRDSTKAFVPGVSIVVTNEGTNVQKTAVSGDMGDFEVTHLVPGTYRLEAELAGFKRALYTRIEVDALTVVRRDVTLEVGEMTQEVTVEAGAPTVESETPTISQSRSFRQLRDLPVNIGGVNPLYNWVWLTPTATQGSGSQRSFGGSRASMTSFTVDGTNVNSTGFGNQVSDWNPSQESLQEVRFDVVLAKAEFAEVGNLTAVTKSGTNDLHGSAFWYNNHSALSARSFFSPTRGAIDPTTGKELYSQNNQLGGSLGGPIVRDRAFFFTAYEYNRDSSSKVLTPSVPTLKMRQGDFSELLELSKPITIKNPLTKEPFPNNQIPATLIYAGSLRYQNRFYPEPNHGTGYTSGNFRGSFPQELPLHQFVGRLDYKLTDSHTLYGRVMYNHFSSASIHNYPPEQTGTWDMFRRGLQVALSDTWTLSPTVINELRLAYFDRYVYRNGNLLPDGSPLEGQTIIDLLGVQGLQSAPGVNALPDVRITGFTQVTVGQAFNYIERGYQFSDNMTWLRGSHTFKFGGALLPQRYTTYQIPNFGRYDFTNSFSGFAYADFLLGLPQTTYRNQVRPTVYARYYDLNFFFQDDFRISSRFTLNYGIRWDHNDPAYDSNNIFSSFDPQTASIVVADQGALEYVPENFPAQIPIVTAQEAGFPYPKLRNGDWNNFAPRLGFAFRPFGDADTVIRGGYGVFFDNLSANIIGNMTDGPFVLQESFRNTISGDAAKITLKNPFLQAGTLGSLNLSFNSPDLISPYSQQWNLTLEKNLGFETGVRISYIGTKTSQILFQRDINQPPASSTPFDPSRRPFPLYKQVLLTENGGNQIYNALTVNMERRMRDGLYFQGNWTWAKNLSDVGDEGNIERGPIIQNQFCRYCERGDLRYTPRHRFVGNVIWELPVGAGKRVLNQQGALTHILGGWRMSSTVIAQTGEYLTPSFTGSDPSNTDTVGGRPDRVADGNLSSQERSIDRWFDSAAFVVPPNGRFGNSGKGVILGPGRVALDFGLFKYFNITEGSSVRFQATATNALNHANFGAPAVNISAPGTVGTINDIYDASDFTGPRSILLGLRYEF
jgi:hypothetical protein